MGGGTFLSTYLPRDVHKWVWTDWTRWTHVFNSKNTLGELNTLGKTLKENLIYSRRLDIPFLSMTYRALYLDAYFGQNYYLT